jgi:hypothetical protein
MHTSAPILETELTLAGRTRRFSIAQVGFSGWECRIEHDGRVAQQTHYTDWHRVERARNRLTRQIQDLKAIGWQEKTLAYP